MADLAQAAAWHRQVAALASAADRAGVATADLPGVRARLLAQQSRLAEAATRTGAPLPALVPSPSEIASAGPALGDLTEAAIQQTVRTMLSTLDAVDAAIGAPAPQPVPTGAVPSPPFPPAGPPGPTSEAAATPPGGPAPPAATPGGAPPAGAPPAGPLPRGPHPAGYLPVGAPPAGPTWPGRVPGGPPAAARPALRNASIYAGFSFGVLVVQIVLFVLLDENTQLPLFAPLCLLVLPAFAWLAGFLTIGVAFRRPPGGPPTPRSPRLGAAICALPDLLLCAAVGVLFVADRVGGG